MNTRHAFFPRDKALLDALRAQTLPRKGSLAGTQARPFYDAARLAAPVAKDVALAAAKLGRVSGWWCRPARPKPGLSLLFVHGGGYMLGSARGYTHFASQIASRVGADTFVMDYRLAPEHAFPAAIDDVLAACVALQRERGGRIGLVGDSAGGGLIFALLHRLAEACMPIPAAAAVMSPWTDLTVSGASMAGRAEADPIFTREALRSLADGYLQGQDARHPEASPLFAPFGGFPPIRIDVGEDEVLLDDSLRLADRLRAANVPVDCHVWERMPHVFQCALPTALAARDSMDGMGAFLRQTLLEPAVAAG